MTAPTTTESRNVQTTRAMYAAVPAGDAETVMANIHPDIEMTYYGTDDVPYAGSYSGAAGFVRSTAAHLKPVPIEERCP